MRERKITFILGAGASYGHILNNIKTPPVMNKFLSFSVKDNILTIEEFPELVNHIQQLAPSKNLLEASKLIESNSNLENFLGNVNDPWILHLGLFYIIRYLGTFCNQSLFPDSGYLHLAKYVRENQKNVNGIINLNYDTLFDQVLNKFDIQFNYAFQGDQSKKLPYIKPHGSLNFRFLYRSFISLPCKDWQEFISKRNSTILTNRFSGRQIEAYEPTFDFEKDFCIEGILKYIPAIVMPIGINKDYFQFDDYFSMWNETQKIMKETSELVVIGCAMNYEDEKLWQSLNNLNRNTMIKIVSSDQNTAEVVADKFIKRNFKNTVPIEVSGFFEYAKNYLSKGKT